MENDTNVLPDFQEALNRKTQAEIKSLSEDEESTVMVARLVAAIFARAVAADEGLLTILS